MNHPLQGLTPVTKAYNRRAAEYTTVLGDIRATSPADQDRILHWADTRNGTICDLSSDPAEEFVAITQKRFPHLNFTCGTARDLPASTFGGILTWYGLIHLSPDELDEELTYIRRVLAPGGSLLLGFFVGEEVEPFEHAITPAWFHPMHLMGKRLETAGFTIRSWNTRCDEGARPHGDIEAVLLD